MAVQGAAWVKALKTRFARTQAAEGSSPNASACYSLILNKSEESSTTEKA